MRYTTRTNPMLQMKYLKLDKDTVKKYRSADRDNRIEKIFSDKITNDENPYVLLGTVNFPDGFRAELYVYDHLTDDRCGYPKYTLANYVQFFDKNGVIADCVGCRSKPFYSSTYDEYEEIIGTFGMDDGTHVLIVQEKR